MGTDMPFVQVSELPHGPEAADKGAVCEAGVERHQCKEFILRGADGCYHCGYLDGVRDGREIEHEMLRADDEARWEGMD